MRCGFNSPDVVLFSHVIHHEKDSYDIKFQSRLFFSLKSVGSHDAAECVTGLLLKQNNASCTRIPSCVECCLFQYHCQVEVTSRMYES